MPSEAKNAARSPATQLPPRYDAAAVQEAVARVWEQERAFHAEPTDPGEPFSIVIPPPNVTGALHLGHALNNTIQDILVRRARMQGKNAVWIPGTDHAGISTQAVVDKRLQAEGKPSLKDYKKLEAEGKNGREQFVALVQAWKDEYEARILEQLKAMGCSCDFERTAFTMDEQRARGVREAFFRLFKDGLIYRGKRLVNWDPATQTALADDEVEDEEIDGHFYYLRYPLEGTEARRHGGTNAAEPEYVTVATTRPETMLGDTAVAINPKDPRAASLRGRFVRLPIVNRLVPIIEDDYVVMADPESDDPKAKYATGFLKVTPAHDPNDWEIGRRHSLPVINIFAPDASISDQHGWPREDFEQGEAGPYLGLDRYEARRAVVAWFRDNKLLEDVKPYRHSVGHSYRSHVPIEPYLSDQWYVAVKKPVPWMTGPEDEGLIDGTDVPKNSLAGLALRALAEGNGAGNATAGDGSLRIVPERYSKTFRQWHESLRDWCISRQLWWGHRIPVWRLPEGRLGDRLSPDQFAAVLENLTGWAGEGRLALAHRGEGREARQEDLADPALPFGYACVRNPLDREFIEELERHRVGQDPDVLDTWFSSALWPMSTLGWPDESAISNLKSPLNVWNPTSVLCTAREILTLWVSRMVMFNRYMRGHPDEHAAAAGRAAGSAGVSGPVPFHTVFIHAMIQDGEGRKMSKSLGNGVDPLDIIDSHGADAMRFTLAQMTTLTQDVRMPVARDEATGKNISPKFDIGRNFCNKLWNAARFVIGSIETALGGSATGASAKPINEHSWSVVDRWILSRLARTVQAANQAIDEFRFDRYATACYDFFWRDFCDWYVEASKPAMKSGGEQAAQTAHVLATCLDVSLRLMHPMIPFATERLWWALCEVMPERGIPGKIMGCANPRLIRAAWPMFDDSMDTLTSSGAERVVERLQEIVQAIRTVRTDNKVEPRKTVPVTIRHAAAVGHHLAANKATIELWATCQIVEMGETVAEPAGAAKTTAANCEIFVSGIADRAADAARLERQRADLEEDQDATRTTGEQGVHRQGPGQSRAADARRTRCRRGGAGGAEVTYQGGLCHGSGAARPVPEGWVLRPRFGFMACGHGPAFGRHVALGLLRRLIRGAPSDDQCPQHLQRIRILAGGVICLGQLHAHCRLRGA